MSLIISLGLLGTVLSIFFWLVRSANSGLRGSKTIFHWDQTQLALVVVPVLVQLRLQRARVGRRDSLYLSLWNGIREILVRRF